MENSDWIEWKGGECPVPPDTMVDVELRCGEAYKGGAGGWSWSHEGLGGDIIAYCILEDRHDD